jgi:hypothetical protein
MPLLSTPAEVAEQRATAPASELSLEALLLRGKAPRAPLDSTTASTTEASSPVSTEPSLSPKADSATATQSPQPVRPPRRDVRRNYLSNLGIGVAAPPLARRPSAGSLAVPELEIREEKLKDRHEQELTFDDLVKVNTHTNICAHATYHTHVPARCEHASVGRVTCCALRSK